MNYFYGAFIALTWQANGHYSPSQYRKSVTIYQNILFCVPEEKESNMGLELHDLK